MIYDSPSGSNKTRLHKLQTRAARLISGSDPCISRISMFVKLCWLSLLHRRDFHQCVMFYICRNGLAPQINIYVICLNLMIVSICIIPIQLWDTKTHIANYHFSFIVSCLNMLNNLPRNIHESNSLSSFKSALYKFISANRQF